MSGARILEQQVGEVVRVWPSLIVALSDVGISPRYLHWTLREAAADAGVAEDRLVARLRPALRAMGA